MVLIIHANTRHKLIAALALFDCFSEYKQVRFNDRIFKPGDGITTITRHFFVANQVPTYLISIINIF